MYIFDALYGKIEFEPLVYRCMMSPEMQRLREVRLCNINSLCITGSANTNRFEHSVGTAYLAKVNIESKLQQSLKLSKKDKEVFVISALLHDVANGPFGHSYEYIMEKQGFIPEKGLKDVFRNVVDVSNNAHGYSSPFEPIFFGKLRNLNAILNDEQQETVSQIIAGNHPLSELISASIDLDNIDNVFRMAYHMGLSFPKDAPIKLAQMMYIHENHVEFSIDAKPYLEEWFTLRRKVYKLLLLNPQEFSGKYMLTEAMDILFECTSHNIAHGYDIKWYYTDYELLEKLNELKEVWIPRKTLLYSNINRDYLEQIIREPSTKEGDVRLKNYIENLTLEIPIKEKGRSGDSNKLELSNYVSFSTNSSGIIEIKDRNMLFEIENKKLYKVVNIRYNPSQIISRLMTGDLYDCLVILETNDISKYGEFLDYSKRINIENELETKIRSKKELSRISIGVHPILDINKTERQLNVYFSDSNTPTHIGNQSSKKLLLGVFLKNEPYGLKHGKIPFLKSRDLLRNVVVDYFASYFLNGAKIVPLYREADEFEY